MRILIGGDSWAMGEWGCTRCKDGRVDSPSCTNNCNSFNDIEFGVRHKGLERYLQDAGHHVVNVGVPGGSNSNTIRALQYEARTNIYDIIFWFETSPYRDITEIPNDVDHLEQIVTKHIIQSYTALDKIEERVYIIGGCAKANRDILDSLYIKPKILVDSLIEWLTEFKQPEIWLGIFNIERLKDLDYPTEVIVDLLERNFIGRFDDPMFNADGAHLSREGHEILFKYLVNNGYI